MPVVSKPLQKAAWGTAMEALAVAGPTLTRIGPIRSAAVGAAEKFMMDRLYKARAVGKYPPRIYEDRVILALAFIHTIERGLAEKHFAPAAMRGVMRILIQDILLQEGNRGAVAQFYERYGAYPPAFLTLSPTKACNLHCTGCYADSGSTPEKLDWDTLDRIVMEAKTLWGGRLFVISGGEPLAYRSDGKGILDIAEKHNDCFFMMYTNGTLIDDQVATRLSRLGNLTPAISAEGWRKRTDARRGQGVFDKIVAAQNRLRDAGVPFGISITATRENCEEILSDDYVDFCFGTQGAMYGWIFQYMPIGRSFTLKLMPTPQQRAWMWPRSWQLIRERQIVFCDFWNHGTTCDGCLSAGRWTGGGYLYIDWNGAVNPCVFLPYSPVNIKEAFARGQTLNDVWADPFFASIRRWQEVYAQKHGNWLAPCPNRDHHAELRQMIAQHEPEPADENAAAALLDPEYSRGMAEYDEAFQKMTESVWQEHYLHSNGHDDVGITPLPAVFQTPGNGTT
jgi:MoaA/NifB/PqqE/SkfB family radical SAM enzyme